MSKEIERKWLFNYGTYMEELDSLLKWKPCIEIKDYYFNDYSLSEIADNLNVSRNAIWDILKKVEHNLEDYETNEITYISSFAIIKGHSVQENYDDVERAMLDASETCEPSEVSEETIIETTEPVE